MSETVNKRIIDKIKNSDLDDSIKEFLRTMLLVELRNIEVGEPRYTDEYKTIINKYVTGRRGK